MSIPAWIRGLFVSSLIGIATILCAHWAYASTTYATKSEVKELKVDLKEDLREIKDLIRGK